MVPYCSTDLSSRHVASRAQAAHWCTAPQLGEDRSYQSPAGRVVQGCRKLTYFPISDLPIDSPANELNEEIDGDFEKRGELLRLLLTDGTFATEDL